MSQYLGLHIIRDRQHHSITLLQDGYTETLLTRFGIDSTSGLSFPSTPMIVDESLLLTGDHSKSNLKELLSKVEIVDFQSRVGALLYLAKQTRPDILFAVTSMARRAKTPTFMDSLALLRILRYLAGTKHIGLFFHSGEGVRLYATVDASYASHDDLKSHTGCTLHIGRHSGSVLSISKKQTITADSSTVAELIAAHFVAKEVMWARNFLQELGFAQLLPTILFEDNMSCIAIIMKAGNNNRSKHIHLRYNMIKELVANNLISVVHLPGVDMTSDILTKALGPTIFNHLRPKLLGVPLLARAD